MKDDSKQLLKLLKVSESLLTEEFVQKLLRIKDLEKILEKELEILLSRKERTIKKHAVYLFNLIIILARLKNKKLIYNIILLSNYPNKFLEKVFGEHLKDFDSICFEMISGNERIYYENIKGKSSKIALSMIVALVQKYRLSNDREERKKLENYIIDIANENSVDKEYAVIKLISIMENGYPKAVRNFNAVIKKVKKENVLILIEKYLDGEKERKRIQKKNSGNIVFKTIKKLNPFI
ncbi:MAG: hypothetical protein ACRCZO_17275 [Cetobacterium sp.]